MALEGVGVTIDVVLEIKAAKEGVALIEINQYVPGDDDGQEKQPARPEEDGLNQWRQAPAETKNTALITSGKKTATGPLARNPRPRAA